MDLACFDWWPLAIQHRFHATEMAAARKVTLRTAERAFHHQYGRTVRAQFEIWRRVQLVELMLANEKSMKEIGVALGYAHCSTFARACREWTGLTPKHLEARLLRGGSV